MGDGRGCFTMEARTKTTTSQLRPSRTKLPRHSSMQFFTLERESRNSPPRLGVHPPTTPPQGGKGEKRRADIDES